MRADLHTHSVFSDGHYTPAEICRRAKNACVELLSITDHDTMNGGEEKLAAAKKYGLKYVEGWEVSAYDKENKIHITGYNCERGKAYQKFMEERRTLSFERAADSLLKLKSLGIDVSLEEVKACRADTETPVHTMHVARAIGRKLGLPESEVYQKYLAPKTAGHSTIGRPTPFEAIDCIHADGGIACIAHPGRIHMSKSELEDTIKSLVRYGLDGIETVYTTHTQEQTAYFFSLAQRLSVLVTGGSDTHYEEETHRIGIPEFHPSEELLVRLKIIG